MTSLKVATGDREPGDGDGLLCLTGWRDQLQADVRPTLEAEERRHQGTARLPPGSRSGSLGEWALPRRLKN